MKDDGFPTVNENERDPVRRNERKRAASPSEAQNAASAEAEAATEAAQTTEAEQPEAVAEDVARLSKEVAHLTEELQDLQAKADEWLDKYRRSVAEFSNYRKRQERDRQQQAWRTNANVIRKLLEPLDDFERALSSVPEDRVDSSWVHGVELIAQKLRGLLAEYNVEPIAAVGQPFDPLYHDALMQEAHDEYPEGTVVQELETGYLMDGQVLRPAVVKVSSGPKGSGDEERRA